MPNLRDLLRQITAPATPLSAGIYATPPVGSPQAAPNQGRLHLRVESDGSGVLVVNAATVLHLNQTGCEYAYHLVRGSTIGEVGSEISRRYNISASQARADYEAFIEQVNTLRFTPDLDPEMYLQMERVTPHSRTLSAPLRIDCALTYRLPEGTSPAAAPTRRVERELSTEEWLSALDSAWQAGIPHVIFTGGEPTLRDDLVDLVTRAEHHGMVTGILTDGLRFNQAGYLDRLLNSGLDHCLFLLAVDQEASWNALRRVLAADIFVGVHITIEPAAIMYDSLMEKLAGMGVRAVSLTAQNLEMKAVLEDAAEKVTETGMALIWDIPVPYSSANPVSLETEAESAGMVEGRAWLYIEPDGDVLPAQGNLENLGNVTRESWTSIWQRAVKSA